MSKALATKNVAAALIGLGLVFAFAFSFATPAKADTLSDLQAQVQALLAQIAALQGGSSSSMMTSGGACFTFTQTLTVGSSGTEVMNLQKFLNGHGAVVASTGAGSLGNETSHFGPATKAAVMKWQAANGVSPASGYWGPLSRGAANKVCAAAGTSTTTGTTGTTPTGAGITVMAGAQPANSLAPQGATRVPFTTFTLTNNSGAAVTINGVTVQRTSLANDASFAGVILIDANGLQYGNSQTFNSNHQATIGGTFTLQAGQSTTFTVAGNMAASESSYAGQVASISVIGVNTSVPVTGSLPISGAQQTVNASLAIGTATIGLSGFDPDGHRSESIGTTGLTFSAIRITAGSAEDEKLYSITWNQTGSAGATDLSNLKTVVNGTSYPVTVDSSGKYYSSTFPGGILISKGNSADVYIQGDISGSDASGRTVEFDIYRSSDIYLVGQTYGYGVGPTLNGLSGTNTSGANTSSGGSSTSNPFYWGTYVSVTGGTLSTVSSASTVAPQNIAINVPNQVLGGFSTNFSGEPVTVQSLTVSVASSSNSDQLKNVTLVDGNGTVVAGPVDETITTSPGTIVFNSSITFPVGPMTYTIKGTVGSSAQNGATYTLSTNPNTQWPSAVGQTSGVYVTLPATTITMSTMTVQGGQLAISASAAPAATTLTMNQNNYTIANVVLDASQSGEDVRLNALPIVVDATGTNTTNTSNSFNLQANLTNCQLFNGSSALNSQSIGTSNWSAVANVTSGALSVDGIESNFIFTQPLTVPKGTTVTLALECNIGGAFFSGEQFAAGVNSNYAPTVTGATSGNSITGSSLTVTNSLSGTMTVGTASLAASVPTPTAYSQAAGGTQNVTVGTFTLQPSSGAVTLQNIGLQLNSNNASSSDLQSGIATIWNTANQQVGSVNFSGKTPSGSVYIATSTISNVTLPQNVQTQFLIKTSIATIGNGDSGTSGHEIRIGLVDAQGTSGNTQVNSGPLSIPTTGVAIFASTPLAAASGSSSGTLLNASGQLLYQFNLTANSAGAIGLKQVGIYVATSSASTVNGTTSVSNIKVYAYDQSGNAVSTGNATPGLLNGTGVTPVNGGANKIAFDNVLQIPANTTYTFKVYGDVNQVAGSNGTHGTVQAYLAGDASDLAPGIYGAAASGLSSANMIWSPNSTTTSVAANADWTSGYGVSGLPTTGLTPATTLSN